MGRNSQELMTGHTHEERVNRAKRRGFFNRIKSLFRLNKPKPMYYPNYRRDGVLEVNPKLMKDQEAIDTSEKRSPE